MIRWEEELVSPGLWPGVFQPELPRAGPATVASFSTDRASRRQRESESPAARHRPGRPPNRNPIQEKRPDAGVRSSPRRPPGDDGSWLWLVPCPIAAATKGIVTQHTG